MGRRYHLEKDRTTSLCRCKVAGWGDEGCKLEVHGLALVAGRSSLQAALKEVGCEYEAFVPAFDSCPRAGPCFLARQGLALDSLVRPLLVAVRDCSSLLTTLVAARHS